MTRLKRINQIYISFSSEVFYFCRAIVSCVLHTIIAKEFSSRARWKNKFVIITYHTILGFTKKCRGAVETGTSVWQAYLFYRFPPHHSWGKFFHAFPIIKGFTLLPFDRNGRMEPIWKQRKMFRLRRNKPNGGALRFVSIAHNYCHTRSNFDDI